MHNPNFNQEQYESYFQQMTDKGIPVIAAKDAAFVIANDQIGEPNLGRTEEDQQKVADAFTWYKAKQEGSNGWILLTVFNVGTFLIITKAKEDVINNREIITGNWLIKL